MSAFPALSAFPLAARFQPMPSPARESTFEDVWRGEAEWDDTDRLPPNVAYPVILLLSVGSWALIATVGLWLYRVIA